jgi:hypothetical protein
MFAGTLRLFGNQAFYQLDIQVHVSCIAVIAATGITMVVISLAPH